LPCESSVAHDCSRSTLVTWLHWSFWTCLRPSTPLTMLSYSDDLKHLDSEEPLYTGSSRTWSAVGSMFVLQSRFHLRPSSSAVYHRALFLAPSSFSYTSPICSCSLKIVFCVRITLQTILRLWVLLANAVLVH